jgi:EAL domain-containing protein (putative c-di-GMP-specific phosphodiesterase class I)
LTGRSCRPRWTALGRGAIALPPNRCIGINISGQTLADAQFLEFVVECLDATGASPAQVCFEIAESAVIANLEHARRFIGVLHGMGCRFALDDFGSGLGSFSNLKLLAVDFLKIDGSFIRNLARDSVNQAMVTAMIKLARTLNFKVIAEQVEDNASLDAARRIGVDYLQGLRARPAGAAPDRRLIPARATARARKSRCCARMRPGTGASRAAACDARPVPRACRRLPHR